MRCINIRQVVERHVERVLIFKSLRKWVERHQRAGNIAACKLEYVQAAEAKTNDAIELFGENKVLERVYKVAVPKRVPTLESGLPGRFREIAQAGESVDEINPRAAR